MNLSQHKNARTTFKIRQEIKASCLSISALSKKYNLSWSTVKKWRISLAFEDKSSRPVTTRTDLTIKEEELICFHRKQFKSTIDEIYLALREIIVGKKLYPMKIYRCLKRHNLEVLPKELKEAERKIRKFKNYGIGYLHIDFIFSKRFGKSRYYVFTCIDRVSKLAYVKLTDSRKAIIAVEFLNEVVKYYPYKINYILTDNGSEFTDTTNKKHPFIKPKTDHVFVKACKNCGIVLRHTKFKSPWTNGMAERFNRRIKEKVIYIKHFKNIVELAERLVSYINKYNFNSQLKALDYMSPTEYLKEKNKVNKEKLKSLRQTLITYRY